MDKVGALPRISLHLIRGFWAAARHLSFTRAAAELFVTQSAVSREVKKLEEQLGCVLFRRVNRSLELTPAGSELYHAVEQALGLIDETTARLAGAPGSLAVTASIPFASLWLVPRLAGFTRRHPRTEVQIAASNEVVDLDQASIDVAIRYRRNAPCEAGAVFLAAYRTFPVCAPALLAHADPPLRAVADLAGHVLLEFETIAHGRPWYDWEQWLRAMHIAPFRPAGRQRFSHYDQVIEAALAGSGVAIGKLPHISGRLRDGSLRAPFGAESVAQLGGFEIVVADAAAGRAAVDAFVAWLREEMRDDERFRPFDADRGGRDEPG